MDVLIIDDEKIIRDAARMIVEDADHYAEVAPTAAAGLERAREETFDLVLLDVNLGVANGLDLLQEILRAKPQTAVVMFTAQASVQLAVEAMRRGALDFLEKPFTRENLHLMLARAQRHRALAKEVVTLRSEISAAQPEAHYESQNPGVAAALDVLFRAAASTASILLLGESGTGKSLVARAIHERSPRAAKPFVTVNCPSLTRELLESELFGHVRGAFTGAVRDAWGKVKAAEGGTLFLDEIGEMPMEIQAKLLRLLQEREFERVGETVTRRADVRVIAATNRDLRKQVAEGAFREDLFYRLNVISAVMPSLRERPEDLIGHAQRYLEFFAPQCGRKIRGFTPATERAMAAYAWPGNLRELRNAIERAVILARGGELDVTDLPHEILAARVSDPSRPAAAPEVGDLIALEDLEQAHLERVIARTASLTEAARVLGIDPATLYRKRKKAKEG